MVLKMKELMARSQESKSTILYYVQKGLLPQPQKPKFNVHLYDESCVHIIKFIKYLQHTFSYSILEIKTIFEDNDFVFDGSMEMMFGALELVSGRRDNAWYSKEDFLKKVKIDGEKCHFYEAQGYFHEEERGYSKAEIAIAETLKQAETLGLDLSLVNEYVKSAQTLAENEKKIFKKFLQNDTHDAKNADVKYRLLFDLVLILKPYVFAKNTLAVQKHESQGN